MRFRRKKASPPMEDLLNLIDSALAAAGESCTSCLIDELGNESSEIGDAIVSLNTAYLMRSITPNGEDNLTIALARFLELVTKMAIFSAELTRRPGVRWLDETLEVSIPIHQHPELAPLRPGQ
jgi:hypothetical protein